MARLRAAGGDPARLDHIKHFCRTPRRSLLQPRFRSLAAILQRVRIIDVSRVHRRGFPPVIAVEDLNDPWA
jgi:ABC-type uncharacterized transport system YnjBCD ATPase subunit